MKDRDLETLWTTAGEPGPAFDPATIASLPEAAGRYFSHAIEAGTPLASAVRLTMHGTIRLKDSWDPFEAEQVLRVHRGFVWRATIRMHGIPVSGSDRWVDGAARVRWKLLGIVPVANESGPEIARSAAGRASIEGVLLPPALLAESLGWEAAGEGRTAARVRVGDEVSRIELAVESDGTLREASMLRWGTPDGVGTPSRQEPFGCVVEAERAFDGITIPTQLRVGWYIGSDRFEEGEFFRASIDEARFR
ncbi:MAG: hypothetical protein PVI30_03265 [Myxococcales bacterium]